MAIAGADEVEIADSLCSGAQGAETATATGSSPTSMVVPGVNVPPVVSKTLTVPVHPSAGSPPQLFVT